MAHFLCHLGCSHFGALLLDFYFTENSFKPFDTFMDEVKKDVERKDKKQQDL